VLAQSEGDGVASLTPKPRNRVHLEVKFAAGAMRVAAVIVLLAGAGGAVAVFNLASIPGAESLSVPPLLAIVVALAAVAFALILWGFADGHVLLADVDDAQRATQRQLVYVVLAQRTERGPFHGEVVAATQQRNGL
jgi:fatty acid desaturase